MCGNFIINSVRAENVQQDHKAGTLREVVARLEETECLSECSVMTAKNKVCVRTYIRKFERYKSRVPNMLETAENGAGSMSKNSIVVHFAGECRFEKLSGSLSSFSLFFSDRWR